MESDAAVVVLLADDPGQVLIVVARWVILAEMSGTGLLALQRGAQIELADESNALHLNELEQVVRIGGLHLWQQLLLNGLELSQRVNQ